MEQYLSMADPSLMEELVSGSNVLTEKEYRDIVLAITEFACSIVTKTLGPYGKTTNIDDSTFTAPTKDGWTVLRNLRFNDALHNSIYNVINQVSFDLVTKVGDGTTSALTGANVFMHEILAELEDKNSPLYNMRQSDVLDLIDEVKDAIVERLRNSSEIRKIDVEGDFEDIYKIAYISSNGNEEMARCIQKIYQDTKNPNIYVKLDSGDKLEPEVQRGYKLDGAVMNQKVYRNTDEGNYVVDTPFLVAIFNHNVTYSEHRMIIEGLSRYATALNTSVLIVAPHFDDIMANILGTTINSWVQQRKIPNIIMMQVPLASPVDRDAIMDFNLLTNGQIFSYGHVRAYNMLAYKADPNNTEEMKSKIEDGLLDVDGYNFETPGELIETCIGHINYAVIGEKYCIIREYESIYNEEVYKSTVKEIEDTFVEIARRTNKSSNMLAKDYLQAQQRYIKMLGSMGTIKVGAQTELEKHCLKDSVDDAVLACRSAFNNGYIRGLNLTTLTVITEYIEELKTQTDIKRTAVAYMFENVFREMSLFVLRNKYPDFERDGLVKEERYHVSEQVNASEVALGIEACNSWVLDKCIASGKTFNLVTNEITEEWSVVNSLATDVEILNSIVGVLSILLTSDQYISINKMYDKKVSRRLQLEREQEKAKAIRLGELEAEMEFIRKHYSFEALTGDPAKDDETIRIINMIFGK